MATSSSISYPSFKSPLRCVCRALYQSRSRWRCLAEKRGEALGQIRRELRRAEAKNRDLVARLKSSQRQLDRIEAQLATEQPCTQWKPLPGHQYSAEVIALCCQLSLLIGFRAVPQVLKCVCDTFGLSINIPKRDAVRNWSCRNGVAILQEPAVAKDWIWMVDHSVQLGKMFVLVVLGIRRTDLPKDRPLRRQDMSPLMVQSTASRNKHQVSQQLADVARLYGTPISVLCDGAAELKEGVKSLESLGFQGVCLDDTKHKVANLLKRTLGKDKRFLAFEAKLGPTIAAIQQTELAYLLPPRKKTKCRFMNFDRLIDWAIMVLRHLDDPVTSPQIVHKLGWLREFRDDLEPWQACRQLIGRVLSQANQHGVYRGVTSALEKCLAEVNTNSDFVCQLRQELIFLYRRNEEKLSSFNDPTIRLPCSTELLESAFGSFKAIQRHHNRGTFTSLLAVFPTLFDPCTPKMIRKRFSSVSNQALKTWLQQSGLTDSTQARRTKAYKLPAIA